MYEASRALGDRSALTSTEYLYHPHTSQQAANWEKLRIKMIHAAPLRDL